MKINLVAVTSIISSFGFRKVVSSALTVAPQIEVDFVIPSLNLYSFRKMIFKSFDQKPCLEEPDLEAIGHHLGRADLVCFSSMTEDAEITKRIIAVIRRLNPKSFIVWGGIHPIADPEDSRRD